MLLVVIRLIAYMYIVYGKRTSQLINGAMHANSLIMAKVKMRVVVQHAFHFCIGLE